MGVLSTRGVWLGMIEGLSCGRVCEFIGRGHMYTMSTTVCDKSTSIYLTYQRKWRCSQSLVYVIESGCVEEGSG